MPSAPHPHVTAQPSYPSQPMNRVRRRTLTRALVSMALAIPLACGSPAVASADVVFDDHSGYSSETNRFVGDLPVVNFSVIDYLDCNKNPDRILC